MDLEDRYKFILAGFWNNSLDSFGHGNIFGWVWEDLDGFERL